MVNKENENKSSYLKELELFTPLESIEKISKRLVLSGDSAFMDFIDLSANKTENEILNCLDAFDMRLGKPWARQLASILTFELVENILIVIQTDLCDFYKNNMARFINTIDATPSTLEKNLNAFLLLQNDNNYLPKSNSSLMISKRVLIKIISESPTIALSREQLFLVLKPWEQEQLKRLFLDLTWNIEKVLYSLQIACKEEIKNSVEFLKNERTFQSVLSLIFELRSRSIYEITVSALRVFLQVKFFINDIIKIFLSKDQSFDSITDKNQLFIKRISQHLIQNSEDLNKVKIFILLLSEQGAQNNLDELSEEEIYEFGNNIVSLEKIKQAKLELRFNDVYYLKSVAYKSFVITLINEKNSE